MPKTLIIMDNRQVAHLLRALLDQVGLSSVLAPTASQGATLVAQERPDLVIVDENLQGTSVIPVVQGIRATPARRNTPILLLASRPTREFVIEAAQAGVSAIQLKPLVGAELVGRIASLVKDPALEAASAEASAAPAEPVHAAAKLLPEVGDLMTLPIIVERVLTITGDRDSGAGDLEKVIQADAACASAVLARANSARFGGNREFKSIKEAIGRIGFKEVRSIVLGLKVTEMVTPEQKTLGFDRSRFWRHSFCCGVVARLLARKAKLHSSADDAFMAGLLLDVGRVALDEYYSDSFNRAMNIAHRNRIPLSEAERKIFGISGAEINEHLLDKWNFPVHIVKVVGAQQAVRDEVGADLDESDQRLLARALWVAKTVVTALRVGFCGERTVDNVPDAWLEELGIPQGIDDEIRGEIFAELDDMIALFSSEAVDHTPAPDPNAPPVTLVSELDAELSLLPLALTEAGYTVTTAAPGDPVEEGTVVFQTNRADQACARAAWLDSIEVPKLVLLPAGSYPEDDAIKKRSGFPVNGITYLSRPVDIYELVEAFNTLLLPLSQPQT